MTSTKRLMTPCLIAIAAACAAFGAQAQTSARTADQGNSFIPYTSNGYVGINVGRSKYDISSGTNLYNFDDSDTGAKIYTGAYFHPNFGAEVGYVNFGKANRGGGDTKAQGLNLSLVGRAPVSEQFDLFGKVGTTYGRTRTSTAIGSGINGGKNDGWGLAYGVGARWAFSPQWAAVLEWESHKLHFSDGNDRVKLTTIGVQYRY